MILDVKIDVGIGKSFSSDFNRKYDLCWEAGFFKTLQIQWFSMNFLFIEKSRLRCLGIAYWCHSGRSLVSLG